jgi:hypothetical protein
MPTPLSSIDPGLAALYNTAAYGTRPIIPATSTNTTDSTSGWSTSLPDYANLASLQSGNIHNQLSGTLNPQDLANAQTWAAQRGISSGTGFGSPNNMAAYQQFLGLSAQQLEQQGQQNLNAALNAAPRTTTTHGSTTTDNNVLQALAAAAPDPYAAAMANLAAQAAGLRNSNQTGGGGALSDLTSNPLTPSQVAGANGGYQITGGGAPFTPNPANNIRTGAGPAQAAANLTGPLGPSGGGGNMTTLPGEDPAEAFRRWQQSQQGIPLFDTPTSHGANASPGSSSSVLDEQGNEWLDVGGGTYMNLSTGEVQQGAPNSSNYGLPAEGSWNTGSLTPNPFDVLNPPAGGMLGGTATDFGGGINYGANAPTGTDLTSSDPFGLGFDSGWWGGGGTVDTGGGTDYGSSYYDYGAGDPYGGGGYDYGGGSYDYGGDGEYYGDPLSGDYWG